MSTGKWAQAGVPHKGWTCTGVEDLGEPSATCEMCEVMTIRYVHRMEHPHYPEELAVGCHCAERMEEDSVRPRERETRLKNAVRRRARWLTRNWRVSAKGNQFLNADGFNIVVYPSGPGWMVRIANRTTNESWLSKKRYPTQDAAKLVGFDGLVFVTGKRTPSHADD